jgi:hypothetical protein
MHSTEIKTDSQTESDLCPFTPILGCKTKVTAGRFICDDCSNKRPYKLEEAAGNFHRHATWKRHHDAAAQLHLAGGHEQHVENLAFCTKDLRCRIERQAYRQNEWVCPTDSYLYRDNTHIAALREDTERCSFVDEQNKFCNLCVGRAARRSLCTDSGVLKTPKFDCILRHPKYVGRLRGIGLKASSGCRETRMKEQVCEACWVEHRKTKKSRGVLNQACNATTRALVWYVGLG